MVKKDKEFGEWVSTVLIQGKLSIRRFERGIVVKDFCSDIKIIDRICMPLGTKAQDTTDLINDYYNNLKSNKEKIK